MSVWRYDGKRALVTGCASGMGQEVVRELLDLGAHVIGLDIATPSLAVHQYVQVDLTDPVSIDAAAAQVDGPIDALFNCAGVSGSLGAEKVMKINIVGLRHLTEALLPKLRPGSAVTAIASTAAVGFEDVMDDVCDFLDSTSGFDDGMTWVDAHPQYFATGGYAFSKSAVITYHMRKAVELGPQNIRFNTIGPGVTDTPFLDDTRKKIGEACLAAIPKPLGRLARPEEMARVLVFLNCDAASYVTGANLWVDGGFMGGALTGMIDGERLGFRRRGR